MNRNRKLWWTALSLELLALGLVSIGIYLGHLERSISLMVLAVTIGVSGIGLDIWVRTSPGSFNPSSLLTKHPVLTSALFWAAMAALSVALVFLVRLDPRTWKTQLYSGLKPLALLVVYWTIIFAVRFMRLRAKR